MFSRRMSDLICVWAADDDPKTALARILLWPVPIETDNTEVWDGGGA